MFMNIEDFKNKVIQGDCLEVMKGIPDKSVDMVLTSPPYDNLRDYKGYTFNFEGIAKEIYRVLKDGGVCVWVVGDATIKGSETGTSFKQALYFKEIGFNLHDTMIYRKINPMPVKSNRYLPCFEFMFVLSKGKPKSVNLIREKTLATGKEKYTGTQQENGKFGVYGKNRNLERDKYNVWDIKVGSNQSTKDKIAFQHPAIFPEKLAEDHILSWSNEGDIILDPMAGSGTTLKMAKKNNRNYVGIEIAPEYIEIIKNRLTPASQDKE